jgi:hypothetical protein
MIVSYYFVGPGLLESFNSKQHNTTSNVFVVDRPVHTMLAGIRTGKKKRKAAGTAEAATEPAPAVVTAPVASVVSRASESARASAPSETARQTETTRATATAVAEGKKNKTNESIADQLRRSLQAGGTLPVASVPASAAASSGSSYSKNERISSALDALERRGRVEKATGSNNNDDDHDHVVVMAPGATSTTAAASTDGTTSIQDMVAQERKSSNMSAAELEMRNVMRTNKRRKVKVKTLQRENSDEDFQRQLQTAVPDLNDNSVDYDKKKAPSSRTTARAAHREQNQQLARHDRQDQMTAKCWWWLESSNFARHRLLALGDHVSLVMAPDHLSVKPGQHFYLVPLKHVESLTAAEDDVWEEIQRFQSSLRACFAKDGKNVLFCETVLNNTGFWQTKLEAIVVPNNTWLDAPLFFKSALTEQAQDWGTHQKLMLTVDKGLRRSVPKNFDYFYLQWDHTTFAGYAQMIESTAFPRDFGVDTIAGMMGMDPMRFRRNQKAQPEQERQGILDFLEKFKPFDWTVDLDK